MRRLLAAVLVLMIGLCSCVGNGDSNDSTNAEVNVCMGYSLEQFGLKLKEETGLAIQQMKYNDEVNVNGNYTEVYDKTGDGNVSLLALQGFYREDLKSKQIFINNRTFSEEQLQDFAVYEDEKLVVYDISYYVYEDSAAERLDSYGICDFKSVDCIHHPGDYIVQKNPGQARPGKGPQKTQNAQKMQIAM